MEVSATTINIYKRHYENLSRDQIKKHIEEFEKVFIVGGIISEMSSNYSKYLRGWLVCMDNITSKINNA